MTGGMSRSEELGECRRFWIEERQSVPGFLAQVTTEMFEKTTVSQPFVYGCMCERGNLAELAIRMEGATESVCLKMDDGLALVLVWDPIGCHYDMTLSGN